MLFLFNADTVAPFFLKRVPAHAVLFVRVQIVKIFQPFEGEIFIHYVNTLDFLCDHVAKTARCNRFYVRVFQFFFDTLNDMFDKPCKTEHNPRLHIRNGVFRNHALGRFNLHAGKLCVPLTRESSEPLIPGAMTPPINSLFSLMILNVVAVPKSTTMNGIFSQ